MSNSIVKAVLSLLKEDKNTHMEHIEDLVFNAGVEGTRNAINFLRDLRNMLAGHSSTEVTATVKWDGAPSVFAGIDPRDGKFFVAKKGVFNKEPKVYKTASEVDSDTSGDLAEKLKIALAEFSKLGITKGVYQGDLMFINSDLKKETIDEEEYITFHPNTIVYAVPLNSPIGKRIESAKVGVVWHTTYSGESFETMKASFGESIVKHMKSVPSVWMDDANYKDYTGVATFTKQETELVTSLLSKAGSLFKKIKADTINGISNDTDLLTLVKTFNNTKVRAGDKIVDTKKHVSDLYDWIHARYQKDIDSKKTEKGKQSGEEKRKKVLAYFDSHEQNQIAMVFELSNLISDIKSHIISKMNQAGNIKTFLKTASGFTVTGVEGFVAIDRLTNNAVKIVDRMEFSRANFSPEILKGWQR